jgi:hypothetical protein
VDLRIFARHDAFEAYADISHVPIMENVIFVEKLERTDRLAAGTHNQRLPPLERPQAADLTSSGFHAAGLRAQREPLAPLGIVQALTS